MLQLLQALVSEGQGVPGVLELLEERAAQARAELEEIATYIA